MRVVREQMLCIISPQWPGGVAALSSIALQGSLRRLLVDVDVVHFATIVLLPPLPGAGPGALPSLMLELAVDEGVRPHELLARLARHPSGALWAIYDAYWPIQAPASIGERNAWVLRHLVEGLSVPDGAFVGTRDRTVSQIRHERALYNATRAQARAISPADKRDRETFALALARWALAAPQFNWAANPAPRSYWRAAAAGIDGKLYYFAAIAGLAWAFVWLARGAVSSMHWLWTRYVCADCGGPLLMWLMRSVSGALDVVVTVLSGALHAGPRLLIVVLFWALVYGIVWGALPAIFPPWRRWQDAVSRELDRPTQTWSSRLTYLGGWIVAPSLLLPPLASIVFAVCCVAPLTTPFAWVESRLPPWLVPGAVAFVALACALTILLGWRSVRTQSSRATGAPRGLLGRQAQRLGRWFYRPYEDEIPRAQQIHPAIERCESELVGGTAHMVSLTELRRPYAWSAWWTRFVLRAVTYLGRIFFTEGRLGDAPGIHFGHWHIVEGGRRLLFCSNFDGTFGGYLDDFINGPSGGTTLFWRWTRLLPRQPAAAGQPGVEHARNFPPTRFLVYRGVKCELKFKAYARDSMLPHLFRFDACGLTIDEKNRATDLRDALFGDRTDAKDDQIMRALES